MEEAGSQSVGPGDPSKEDFLSNGRDHIGGSEQAR